MSAIVQDISPTSWPTGAYVGTWGEEDHDRIRGALALFEGWRSREADVILDWVAAASVATWTQIEGDAFAANKVGVSEAQRFVLTNIPLPADVTMTLAAGAAGTYDAHWTAFAENLVSVGLADIRLRLFHEFNGNWYRWSLGWNYNGGNPNYADPDGGAADFIAYWRNIHTAMRAAGFTGDFVFCPNMGINGTTLFDPTPAYPGDAYVDIVAPDCYDQSYRLTSYPYVEGESQAAREAKQDAAWDTILTGERGLEFWRDFVIAHGKQFGLTEWGMMRRSDGHGGEDDPAFIRRMHQFLAETEAAHPGLIAYDCYFNPDFTTNEGIYHFVGPGSEFPVGSQIYRYRWSQ